MNIVKTDKKYSDIAIISEFLRECFSIFNQFNKIPQDLEIMIPVFCRVLDSYKISELEKAFEEYFRTRSEMPVPSNIVKIIEFQNMPSLSEILSHS